MTYNVFGGTLNLAQHTYLPWHTHTHTHTLNGLFSRTTWVIRHRKGKPFWILLKQKMMGWQWHQAPSPVIDNI